MSTGQYDNSQHCKPVSAKRTGGKNMTVKIKTFNLNLWNLLISAHAVFTDFGISDIRLNSTSAKTREKPPPLSP